LERKKYTYSFKKIREDNCRAKLNPRGLGHYKQVAYHPLDKAGGSPIHF